MNNENMIPGTGPTASAAGTIDTPEFSDAVFDYGRIRMGAPGVLAVAYQRIVSLANAHGAALAEEARREAYARGRGDAVRDYIRTKSDDMFCQRTADDFVPQYETMTDHNGKVTGVRMTNADQTPPVSAAQPVAEAAAQADDVTVPRNPTVEQVLAGQAADPHAHHVTDVYTAMLAATPTAQPTPRVTPEMTQALADGEALLDRVEERRVVRAQPTPPDDEQTEIPVSALPPTPDPVGYSEFDAPRYSMDQLFDYARAALRQPGALPDETKVPYTFEGRSVYRENGQIVCDVYMTDSRDAEVLAKQICYLLNAARALAAKQAGK